MILLAQTRQADRDKFAAQEADKRHRELEQHQEREAARTLELLEANTALTRQTEALAEQIAQLGGSVLPVFGSGRTEHRPENEIGHPHADAAGAGESLEAAQ